MNSEAKILIVDDDPDILEFLSYNLKKEGYDLYNYSVFDFDGQPSVANPTFLQAKTKPIVSQTFLFRIQRDLWYHLVTDLRLSSVISKSTYHDRENNIKIYNLTKKIASKKTAKPKFVYTHLTYPVFQKAVLC